MLIVGDLNARVGSTERGGSSVSWPGVRGVHGVGKVNEAGAELLSFCALNELTIMNTHFKKNNNHHLAASWEQIVALHRLCYHAPKAEEVMS